MSWHIGKLNRAVGGKPAPFRRDQLADRKINVLGFVELDKFKAMAGVSTGRRMSGGSGMENQVLNDRNTTQPMNTKLHILVCVATMLAGMLRATADTNRIVNERLINADLRQVKGPFNTMFKNCVGAGRANEGLRADWQRQLVYAHKECGFTYIRMHGLFCDDMGVYKENKQGIPEYNWQYIDELYDFLNRIGMKPFVELSFTPAALASGSQTIFWWKGNVTKPRTRKSGRTSFAPS